MKVSSFLLPVLLTLLVVFGLFSLAVRLPDGGGYGWGRPGVGILRLDGQIDDSREFLDELDDLRNEHRVKGLVLRIDSPGGGVGASQEMYEAIRRYRAETGQPVVASIGDMAASGGYYVACAADRIVANPGSITGSIGVLLTFMDAQDLLDRIGLRFRTVKSGPMKDQGAFWRDMTEEERVLLQSTVDDVYRQFVGVVVDARRLPEEQVLAIADGRILSGRQAFEAGLVDTLGDLEAAADLAADLAGLDRDAPRIERPEERPSVWDLVPGAVSGVLGGVGGHGPAGPTGVRLEYRLGLSGGGMAGTAGR